MKWKDAKENVKKFSPPLQLIKVFEERQGIESKKKYEVINAKKQKLERK